MSRILDTAATILAVSLGVIALLVPSQVEARSALFATGQAIGADNSNGLSLADLDGDGELDLFFANGEAINEGVDEVWLGDGEGTFVDSGQRLGPGTNSYDVAVADLDGDGDLDALVANWQQPNTVWLNQGNGTFVEDGQFGSEWNPKYRIIVAGDLDGDGDVDAYLGTQGQPDEVWANDGRGKFILLQELAAAVDTWDVKLGDVNADGRLDAFVATGTGFHGLPNQVWFGSQGGGFDLNVVEVGETDSQGVALGDLDRNGTLDAFLVSLDTFEVWLNDGSGNFTQSAQGAVSHAGGNGVVSLGDFDRDGDLDAFLAHSGGGNEVWLNDGAEDDPAFSLDGAAFGERRYLRADIAAGDLDDDGSLDVVVANYGDPGNELPPDQVWINQVDLPAGPVVFTNLLDFEGHSFDYVDFDPLDERTAADVEAKFGALTRFEILGECGEILHTTAHCHDFEGEGTEGGPAAGEYRIDWAYYGGTEVILEFDPPVDSVGAVVGGDADGSASLTVDLEDGSSFSATVGEAGLGVVPNYVDGCVALNGFLGIDSNGGPRIERAKFWDAGDAGSLDLIFFGDAEGGRLGSGPTQVAESPVSPSCETAGIPLPGSIDISLAPHLVVDIDVTGAGWQVLVGAELTDGGMGPSVRRDLPRDFVSTLSTAVVPANPPVSAVCGMLRHENDRSRLIEHCVDVP